jgi:hypothetical protein
MTLPTHVAIIFSVCPLGIREAGDVELGSRTGN